MFFDLPPTVAKSKRRFHFHFFSHLDKGDGEDGPDNVLLWVVALVFKQAREMTLVSLLERRFSILTLFDNVKQ